MTTSQDTRTNLAGKPEGGNSPVEVPDTLDLADRAALAINGIGGTIDPDLHHQMFFLVRYGCQVPFMQHISPDTTCDPKYAESLPMLRLMSGSDRYKDIEAAQQAELLSRIEDGLYWNRADPARPWRNTYNPLFDHERGDQDLSNMVGNARMLRALLVWRELSGGAEYDKPIRELVRGMRRVAIDRDDYSYYPDGGFGEPFNYPRSGWQSTDEPSRETEGGEGSVLCYHGHQIQALARWYAMSGDPEALDLATRLTRFCMLPKLWGGVPDAEPDPSGQYTHIAHSLPDPACVAGQEQGHWYSHFHARAVGLRGMLEYARAVGDTRVLEFVRRAYEYTWTLGIPRIGWVNTYPAKLNLCEGCALGDLTALGVRLTDAGAGDYWDDVDAIVRNHLVEQQVTRADLLEKIVGLSPEVPPEERPAYPNQAIFGDQVIPRSLGNFFGSSTPTSVPIVTVIQCCTGNATQGLYYGWEAIVREEGESAQVNLLLNRSAKSVDVESYLPYEGKVVIQNKTARRVSVRIPWWVQRRDIRADVSGQARTPAWVGNYLLLNDLIPGDVVTLQFPVTETSASYTVNSRTSMQQTYACTFRGSTLIDISPRDETPEHYPLYLRDHMQAREAPMKVTTRFVPDKVIRQW